MYCWGAEEHLPFEVLHRPMPTFAAVDLGSNSCRLKIASFSGNRLKTLHEDREVNRLGESVFQTGMISPEAMEITLRALKRFQKATQLHVVDRVRLVATSAMRDARNAEAFIEWVKADTGWNIEVISGLEEGRLIHLGVVTYEPGATGKCLLIDLGGGSCEITVSVNSTIKSMVSTPLGAVRLQQFLQKDPPAKEDIARLKQYVERELARAERKLPGAAGVELVIATSGTAGALAEASLATRKELPAKRTAGKNFVRLKVMEAATPDVRALADKLVRMTNAQREAVPGIGPRRSEIIIGGATVYASLLERFGLKGFRYSELGLRDGMLAQMRAELEHRGALHQKIENERWAGVLGVCRRYSIEERRMEPVRQHAVELFDALQSLHALPEDYRLWLESAAMMQDVGKFVNHQGHHRHTQYIIANSEIFGFSPEQRGIVSAIARYLGKTQPDAADRPMRAIPIEEHTRVKQAVVLLRLAVALNQDRATAALKLHTLVYPKRVVLELRGGRSGAELEAWALRREAPYFREIFRRELLVEVA